MADVYLDLLMRHMAWANQEVFTILSGLEDGDLALVPPGCEPDWNVGHIAIHIARAARGYATRLRGEQMDWAPDAATKVSELGIAALKMAEADLMLREQISKPDELVTFKTFDGETRSAMRSTILAQSIHHATEHRAQIADALTAHGKRVIDLDELDLWSFAEKVG